MTEFQLEPPLGLFPAVAGLNSVGLVGDHVSWLPHECGEQMYRYYDCGPGLRAISYGFHHQNAAHRPGPAAE